MTNNTIEKVAEVVRLFYRPVTASEISEAANLSRPTTLNALKILVENGRLEVIANTARRYYRIREDNKTKEEDYLEEKFARLDSALNERIEQHNQRILRHEKRILQVEKNTSHFYGDMISIMGIFVAIFALIVINTNAIAGAFSAQNSLWENFLTLFVLNVPAVICILALLCGIRWIILRDFKTKPKDKQREDNPEKEPDR